MMATVEKPSIIPPEEMAGMEEVCRLIIISLAPVP